MNSEVGWISTGCSVEDLALLFDEFVLMAYGACKYLSLFVELVQLVGLVCYFCYLTCIIESGFVTIFGMEAVNPPAPSCCASIFFSFRRRLSLSLQNIRFKNSVSVQLSDGFTKVDG